MHVTPDFQVGIQPSACLPVCDWAQISSGNCFQVPIACVIYLGLETATVTKRPCLLMTQLSQPFDMCFRKMGHIPYQAGDGTALL